MNPNCSDLERFFTRYIHRSFFCFDMADIELPELEIMLNEELLSLCRSAGESRDAVGARSSALERQNVQTERQNKPW